MISVEPLFKDNLKVHFAGCENLDKLTALHTVGVKYFLFTCYPFVKQMINGKLSNKNRNNIIPSLVSSLGEHVIMDSGLFTLMFGADKGKRDEAFLYTWMLKLVEFVKETGFTGTCVEVDCQKILSPEIAWKFRKEMKRLLPDNRIINVFHLEDGKKGLDRLIDFSDYIAISVPELRIHKNRTYKTDVAYLTRYIKKKKPQIDIHLLGCTESKMLKENSFCTSADSTTWSAIVRWPKLPFVINGKKLTKHIKNLDESKLLEFYAESLDQLVKKYRFNPRSKPTLAKICLAGELCLHEYDYLLGNQR